MNAHPISWLLLRHAYDFALPKADTEWAVRAVLEDDGTCRLYPLFPADLPAFVDAAWNSEPDEMGWSVKP